MRRVFRRVAALYRTYEMQVAEKLDNLRLTFPACRVLVFADISTGMVLCASTKQPLRQEHLDSLCGTAAEMLTGGIVNLASDAIGRTEGAGVFQAIIVDDAEIGVFMRSAINPADALCCLCATSIDLGEFTQTAREVFTQLGQET